MATTLSKSRLLSIVRMQQKRIIEAKHAQDVAVAALRSAELDGHCLATWEEVAAQLGVTKSAAQQRYSHLSWGGRADDATDTAEETHGVVGS